MDVGELISKYRKHAGITIDELSEKSGVPKGTLNKIINGVTKSPSLDSIKAIAYAMNCTLEDFDDHDQECANSLERTELLPEHNGIGLDENETILIQNYRELNENGRGKLIDYSNDLIQTGRYVPLDQVAELPPEPHIEKTVFQQAGSIMDALNNPVHTKK